MVDKIQEISYVDIDANHRLVIEPLNIVLQKKKITVHKTAGSSRLTRGGSSSVSWGQEGCYSTIPAALRAYCFSSLKSSKTVEDLVSRMDNLDEMFDGLLKKQEVLNNVNMEIGLMKSQIQGLLKKR